MPERINEEKNKDTSNEKRIIDTSTLTLISNGSREDRCTNGNVVDSVSEIKGFEAETDTV